MTRGSTIAGAADGAAAPALPADPWSSLPREIVDRHPAACTLAAQDIFFAAAPVMTVLRPRDEAEVQAIVRAAARAGVALIPRGAGASYTAGVIDARLDRVAAVDLTALDRVVEIRAEDMVAVVEAGCRWATLRDALRPCGLRAAYWGPLSGLRSTIGGAVAQNTVFWGAGTAGSCADTVVGMRVVTGTGELVATGALGHGDRPHSFRHDGPDLTGLFTGDAGALGIKTRIALRLVPEAGSLAFGSFVFGDAPAMLAAMAAIAREGLATECMGFDAAIARHRMPRAALRQDIASLAAVMRAAGGPFAALRSGLSLVAAGRRFLGEAAFALHVIAEGRARGDAARAMRRIRRLCRDRAGRPVAPSIPRMLRAEPFRPIITIVGRDGERWAPVHGVLPHSQGAAASAAVHALFDARRPLLERHRIEAAATFVTVGAGSILVEPVFFWPDALDAIHHHLLPAEFGAALPVHPADLAARAAVAELRAEVAAILRRHGAVHLQRGRFYPAADDTPPATAALLDGIKRLLDPDGLINPGALGLAAAPPSSEGAA